MGDRELSTRLAAPGADLFTEEARRYFDRLTDEIDDDVDSLPTVAIEEVVAGQTVRIIDFTATAGRDRPVRRHFLWVAVSGDAIELRPAPFLQHDAGICRIIGGVWVTQSTRSAADALSRARQILAGR